MKREHFRVWNVLLVTFFVVLLIVIVNMVSDDDDGRESSTDSLKFLVIISRHGNRGATEDYVNDPYPMDNPNYWPYGSSGLTPHGRTQMYNLGVRVRSLYNGFLNSTYYPEELHASSTYMDRMLMSGEAFLAGLYPPKGWQLWNTNIPWQPTPIYSDSPDNTPFLMDCPRYVAEVLEEIVQYFNSTAGNLAFINDLLNRYSSATGEHITNPIQLPVLWDKLISEETEGYVLPEWTKLLYPQPLVKLIGDLYMAAFAGTDDIIRLLIGNFYAELSDTLSSKANGSTSLASRRVQYYSAHDSSIIALQVLMGVPQSSVIRVIKAGSSLLVELHEHPITKQYSVRLLYINGGSKDLDVTPLPITGCGQPCALPSLLYNTVKYTKVNFTEECTLSSSNSKVSEDVTHKKFSSFILRHST